MKPGRCSSRLLSSIFITASLAPSVAHAGDATMQEQCHATSTRQVEALFDEWNAALQAGEPERVVALYAADSVLLPTLSAIPRVTRQEKIDYFKNFMLLKPAGNINSTWVSLGCNSAVNSGLYTFKLKNGKQVKARYTFTYEYRNEQWLITSHHSSIAPR